MGLTQDRGGSCVRCRAGGRDPRDDPCSEVVTAAMFDPGPEPAQGMMNGKIIVSSSSDIASYVVWRTSADDKKAVKVSLATLNSVRNYVMFPATAVPVWLRLGRYCCVTFNPKYQPYTSSMMDTRFLIIP